MTTDVLNLEWSSCPSRDRESATLVCNFLRLNGIEVHEGSIFNGFYLIDTLKPTLVFVTNSIGATLNRDIVRYAKSKGIHCVSASSEGNFKQESIMQFLWGHNAEQVLYEDLSCLWNRNALMYSLSAFPELTGRLSVCGGIGFDRYKLGDKDALEVKYKNSPKKLKILVSCWNFDFLCSSSDSYGKFNGKALKPEDISFFEHDLRKFNTILNEVIRRLPHIDFVLKMHPGCQGGEYYSGIDECRQYKNVRIIQNEVAISELILQSNLVLSYESTTALEAWLCAKETALINPSGVDFIMREGFHLGQPNFPTVDSLYRAILHLEEFGELPNFNDFKQERDSLIEDIIGWQDGLNHVRIANDIISQLGAPATKVPLSTSKFRFMMHVFGFKAKWNLYPILQRFFPFILPEYKRRVDWEQSEVERFAKFRLVQQKKFYADNGYSLEHLSTIRSSREFK